MQYDELLEEEKCLAARKGLIYAGREGELEPIKKMAAMSGLTPQEIILILMLKHLLVLFRVPRDKTTEDSWEDIKERILDVRVSVTNY